MTGIIKPAPLPEQEREAQNGIGLRPHHALCAHFFVGNGYSEAFVAHMYRTLATLNRDGAAVTLTDGCDAICAGCPNNPSGICEADEKVRAIDRRAVAAMGLHIGDALPWRSLCRSAERNIITPGRLREVCGDCEWIGICGKMAESETEADQ